MIRRALVGALVLLGVAAGVVAADGPISPSEYRAIVHQAFTLVERAAAEPNVAARAPLFTQAGDTLARVTDVEMAPGANVRIVYSGLVDDLRAAGEGKTNVDVGDLHDRLAALDAAVANPPREPNPNDRAKLSDILDRPPFTAENENLLVRLQRQFLEWLRRLFSNTASGVFDFRDAIVLVGTGIVAVVLLYLLNALRLNLIAGAQLKRGDRSQAPLTAAVALVHAQRFASAGDYREAVRELYLATLLLLEERGLLRYDRTLTNREYLAELERKAHDRPTVLSAFAGNMQTLERVWYGDHPATSDTVKGFESNQDVIMERADAPAQKEKG